MTNNYYEETLDKCPRRVLRVLICIRPIGSMLPVAWNNNMMIMTLMVPMMIMMMTMMTVGSATKSVEPTLK